ncbi:MAG: hypothetical protein K0S65_5155, partial [Labilithrix sp.]|nr:hypothetical protein [Labilithrix sp.]
VVAVPKSGGPVLTVAEEQDDTYQIAVDGSGVYWSSCTGLMRANLDGSGARPLIEGTCKDRGPVALSPETIYWSHKVTGTIDEVRK